MSIDKGTKMMSEIEILTQQLTALEPMLEDFKLKIVGLLLVFTVGGIAGLILLLSYREDFPRILGLIMVLVAFTSGIILFTDLNSENSPVKQRDGLQEQRDLAVRENIKQLTCEQIRLDILSIMENEEVEEWLNNNLSFEQEYYYHKCEIPLLEEVKKLQ